VRWSILAPSIIQPQHKDGKVHALDTPQGNSIVLGAGKPPMCEPSWLTYIPLAGIYFEWIRQTISHIVTFEDLAGRLAEDLSQPDQGERWVGKIVGAKNVPGTKLKSI
jgi:hypothetical protein